MQTKTKITLIIGLLVMLATPVVLYFMLRTSETPRSPETNVTRSENEPRFVEKIVSALNQQRRFDNAPPVTERSELVRSAAASCDASHTGRASALSPQAALQLRGEYSEVVTSYRSLKVPTTEDLVAGDILATLLAKQTDSKSLVNSAARFIGVALCSKDDVTLSLDTITSNDWIVVAHVYAESAPSGQPVSVDHQEPQYTGQPLRQAVKPRSGSPGSRPPVTGPVTSPPVIPTPPVPTPAATCRQAPEAQQSEYIQWDNASWWVRDIAGNPGNSSWGRMHGNVCVMTDGSLNLAVQKVNNTWYSAEVDIQSGPLGYGEYSFTYDIDPAVAPGAVLGLFVYDRFAPANSYREIDIELTKWGDTANTSSAWYSVHDVTGHRERMSDHGLSGKGPYTSKFIWQPNQVYFQTIDATGALIGENLIRSGVQDPGQASVAMNLWMMDGHVPATDRVEARIYDFTFTPNRTQSTTKASAFQSHFSTPEYWARYRGASVTNRTLVLPTVSNYSEAYAGTVLDLRDSQYVVRIAELPQVGNGTTEADIKVEYDANNAVQVYVSNGELCAYSLANGSRTTRCFGVYDLATQSYVRFRHANNAIYLETSADNQQWTTHWTFTSPLSIDQLQTLRPSFASGYWGTETAPGRFVVSEINP